MLPKLNRLKKRKDLEKVFKSKQKFKQDCLILKIVKNNLKISRFGFVISKNISKKAVIRNKVRRRLQAVLKEKLPQIKKGWDGVLVAFPGLETKTFQQIKEILDRLFKKAGLI